MEPQLHRPRPDHRRRGPRRRHPRRLLRLRRRAARPGPEPHAPAPLPRGDGAAGGLHRRRGAQREGQGPARDPRAVPRTTSRTSPCARSTPRARRAARTSPATARRRASRRTRTPRPYAALRLEVDNWRWAGVPFYLRTGKRLARKVTEIAITLQPVPHLGFTHGRLGRRQAQPARDDAAAQRGRVAAARGEDPRDAHADHAGEHGVPVRHVVHVAVARGLRTADPRRDARRRDALHPQRRGRGPVAHHRPGRPGVGAERRRASPSTRRGRRGRRTPTGSSSATTSGDRSEDSGVAVACPE